MLKIGAVLVVALSLSFGVALADPAPDWSSIPGDSVAFDVTVADLGGNTYRWDVTFNGTTLPGVGSNQLVDTIAIYGPRDSDGNFVAEFSGVIASPTGWSGGADGANPAIEWVTKGGRNEVFNPILPGGTLSFTGQLTGPLPNPERWVGIHIRSDTDSTWANETPELPPSALSMLSLGGVWLVGWLRRRRR